VNRTEVELLFATYREPVYRFLRRFLRDGPAAEDLTQEAFLRALGGSWQAGGHARGWIFQIARNLARDHLRAQTRRPVVTPLTGFEGSAAADPAEALALDAALASLEIEDREVFLLKELGGLSYAEIASACGLTPGAVRSRLHRSRITLRRQLT
jgi:RNA polymerase sigma-70 factor (ECF subfamily)